MTRFLMILAIGLSTAANRRRPITDHRYAPTRVPSRCTGTAAAGHLYANVIPSLGPCHALWCQLHEDGEATDL